MVEGLRDPEVLGIAQILFRVVENLHLRKLVLCVLFLPPLRIGIVLFPVCSTSSPWSLR